MFLFATIAYTHGDILDAALVKTLLGFTILEKLKQPIQLKCAFYSNFKREETPNIKTLLKLLENFLAGYAIEEREQGFGGFRLSSKLYRQVQVSYLFLVLVMNAS